MLPMHSTDFHAYMAAMNGNPDIAAFLAQQQQLMAAGQLPIAAAGAPASTSTSPAGAAVVHPPQMSAPAGLPPGALAALKPAAQPNANSAPPSQKPSFSLTPFSEVDMMKLYQNSQAAAALKVPIGMPPGFLMPQLDPAQAAGLLAAGKKTPVAAKDAQQPRSSPATSTANAAASSGATPQTSQQTNGDHAAAAHQLQMQQAAAAAAAAQQQQSNALKRPLPPNMMQNYQEQLMASMNGPPPAKRHSISALPGALPPGLANGHLPLGLGGAVPPLMLAGHAAAAALHPQFALAAAAAHMNGAMGAPAGLPKFHPTTTGAPNGVPQPGVLSIATIPPSIVSTTPVSRGGASSADAAATSNAAASQPTPNASAQPAAPAPPMPNGMPMAPLLQLPEGLTLQQQQQIHQLLLQQQQLQQQQFQAQQMQKAAAVAAAQQQHAAAQQQHAQQNKPPQPTPPQLQQQQLLAAGLPVSMQSPNVQAAAQGQAPPDPGAVPYQFMQMMQQQQQMQQQLQTSIAAAVSGAAAQPSPVVSNGALPAGVVAPLGPPISWGNAAHVAAAAQQHAAMMQHHAQLQQQVAAHQQQQQAAQQQNQQAVAAAAMAAEQQRRRASVVGSQAPHLTPMGGAQLPMMPAFLTGHSQLPVPALGSQLAALTAAAVSTQAAQAAAFHGHPQAVGQPHAQPTAFVQQPTPISLAAAISQAPRVSPMPPPSAGHPAATSSALGSPTQRLAPVSAGGSAHSSPPQPPTLSPPQPVQNEMQRLIAHFDPQQMLVQQHAAQRKESQAGQPTGDPAATSAAPTSVESNAPVLVPIVTLAAAQPAAQPAGESPKAAATTSPTAPAPAEEPTAASGAAQPAVDQESNSSEPQLQIAEDEENPIVD
ncbi:hypothetical protein M3Y99_01544700 [Aphelenchoides fujianensis]|nr:hypothetical protein M3Y99_01544700 [Aphelenchoides fujianensis]